MAALVVDVKPEIWQWVLKQIADMDINGNILHNLDRWVDGTLRPTFRQVEKFSKTTGIPLGYFFLDTPPKETFQLAQFRTINSSYLINPSLELKNTLKDMESVQEWMAEFRQSNGDSRIPWIGSIVGKNVVMAAEKMRYDMKIAENWFEKVNGTAKAVAFFRNKLSECGIVIMMNGVVRNNTHKPLNLQEFRAFALLDEFAPLIFINAADAEAGRLFSLLHEAVHLWMGKSDLFNDNQCNNSAVSKEETFCNAVTAEVLVPQKYFLQKWNAFCGDDVEKIEAIAREFYCSRLVIARRALELRFIKDEAYRKIESLTMADLGKKKKNNSGGDFYKTLVSRLDGNLVRSICSKLAYGDMTYAEAYRLTNTNSKTFSKIASSFGGVGF